MRSILKLAAVVCFAFSGNVNTFAAVGIERSVGNAKVASVVATQSADLVIIDAGLSHGFRQGMVCRVSRSRQNVAELILVDLRERSSIALILDLKTEQPLQPGDFVSVKTVSPY